MSESQRWLFFTAGIGTPEYESSAERLVTQAKSFNLFHTVKAFSTSEVNELCPRLEEWYSPEDLAGIKGYGWYTWKSKLADLVVREEILGSFDGYMYLDSGCEFFLSRMSKRRLESMMENALINQATLFTIPTPEIWHTKKDLLDLFQYSENECKTNQFQSGSWLLSNSEKSKELVRRWEETASLGPHMTDESPSRNGEYQEFKVHRYDQAIFSLVCKNLELEPSHHVVPGSNQSWKYFIRAFSYPFWWARNRTGQTVIPNFMRKLGRLSVGSPRQ